MKHVSLVKINKYDILCFKDLNKSFEDQIKSHGNNCNIYLNVTITRLYSTEFNNKSLDVYRIFHELALFFLNLTIHHICIISFEEEKIYEYDKFKI